MRKVEELESLRGVMAVWVMLGHVYLALPGNPVPILGGVLSRNGFAVDVFIILSGFVIFSLLAGKSEGYWAYITRRFFRIYPLYAACLFASIALAPISHEVLSEHLWQTARNSGRLRILEDSNAYFWPHLWAHLTLLHGVIPGRVLPSSEYAFLGQAWSISLEWQFYLIAPACFAVAAQGKPARISALLLAIVFAHYFLRYFAGEGFLPAAVPYFVLGGASHFVWQRRALIVPVHRETAWVVVLLMTALSLMFANLAVALWVFVLGCLIINEAGHECLSAKMVGKALRLRPAIWLGRISYSIYLIHMMPLYLFMWLMPKAVLETGWHVPLLFASVSISTLILASLTYGLIEVPGMAVGRAISIRFARLGRASLQPR